MNERNEGENAMKIYTRTGDQGTTSLVYGERVSKSDLRVEAYGTVDEANAMIGFAASLIEKDQWKEKEAFLKQIKKIQNDLFHVGSELSTPNGKEVYWPITEKHIKDLEEKIDSLEKHLPSLDQFILPSGHQAASGFHVARTIVRRAERMTVRLKEDLNNPMVLSYLNRLSDYLFVAARYMNHVHQVEEINLNIE